MATTRPNTYVEQTTTTTTSTPGAMRNYQSGDYNNRSSGNYNRDQDFGDSRHHGRWTASGEATDLETSRQGSSGISRRSASSSDYNRDRDYDRDFERRDRDRDYDRRDREYSRDYDRVNRDRDYDRFGSRSMNYGASNAGYDFLAASGSHPAYGGSSYGYGHPGFGSSSYGYGSHPAYGLGMHHSYDAFPYSTGGYHSGYASSYGYPHTAFGAHPYSAMPHHAYGSSALGYGSTLGSSSTFGRRSLSSNGMFRPEADIYELGNDYIIEMDLPGHSKEHIETIREGNQLIILSKPPSRAHHNFHVNERALGQGHFHRKIYLPADASAEAINAGMSNGVLKLVIPRTVSTTTATPILTTTTTTPVLASTVPVVTKDTTTTTTTTSRV